MAAGEANAPGGLEDIDAKIAYYKGELEKLNNRRNFPYVYMVVAIPTTVVFVVLTVISQGLIDFTTGITGALFFSLLITCSYLVLYQPSREEVARDLARKIRNLSRERGKVEAGFRGEREVAYALRWLPPSYVALHDLTLPAGRLKPQQIDHVAIGPNGVFHLETKSINGAVLIAEDGSWTLIRAHQNRVNREGMESPRLQVERHEQVLRQILQKALPGRKVPLTSLVVMANPQTIIEGQDPSLRLVKKDRLLEVIQKEALPQPLQQGEIRRLALALASANLEAKPAPDKQAEPETDNDED